MRQVREAEVQLAEQLLGKLVAALAAPDDGMADNVPGRPPGAGGWRLEGKLKLTLALVQTLDRRSIGTCSDSGLVAKLLSGACTCSKRMRASQKGRGVKHGAHHRCFSSEKDHGPFSETAGFVHPDMVHVFKVGARAEVLGSKATTFFAVFDQCKIWTTHNWEVVIWDTPLGHTR